ncbi:hypothetical protein [Bacteroides pyogenes]|uniref:hypothetical protein n=1 Tax=Bacteroides pyogenes TaxID=310300 RepID=UPI0011C027CF|nr:hypothetical protein [Bacteroides pyogenes]
MIRIFISSGLSFCNICYDRILFNSLKSVLFQRFGSFGLGLELFGFAALARLAWALFRLALQLWLIRLGFVPLGFAALACLAWALSCSALQLWLVWLGP